MVRSFFEAGGDELAVSGSIRKERGREKSYSPLEGSCFFTLFTLFDGQSHSHSNGSVVLMED